MKRSVTGIRASGDLHLGNYLGAMRPGIKLQEKFECLYFIADMHALTTQRDPKAMKEKTLDIVASWLAIGFDPKRNLLYRQSDLPMVAEFAWYLSCVTGVGLLEKGHSYKDAIAKSKEVSHGVLAYPVLMAADIIMYDVDVVPVGKDQKQHVEMARDMAGSFNAQFGEGLLKLPEPLIDEQVMLIPGLDGQKMSKSYNNVIPLFCPEAELKRLVMSIKTDSSTLEAPKKLDGTLVGQLFSLLGSNEQYQDLAKRMLAGGMGWGHAKQELFGVINEHVSPFRKRYDELRKDTAAIEAILKDGAQRAYQIASPVLNRVRQAVGFAARP